MGSAACLDPILGGTRTISHYRIADPANRPALAHNAYDSESDSIPCINIAIFRGLPPSSRREMLDEFVKGVSEWGFFHVTGHDVGEQILKDMAEMVNSVFQMPYETKLKAASNAFYSGYMCGKLDAKGIWQESVQTTADPEAFKAIAEKLWPGPGRNEPEKFKEIYHKYTLATEKLGLEVFELLEEALGVEKKSFTELWDLHKNSMGTLIRLIHYPPCEEPEAVLGAMAHTDPNIITILHQDDIGGLQILKNGKWIACKPQPGAFIINVGDCLQVASNDILPSVQHRVCVNKERSRISFATFISPQRNGIIQPSPELVDEEHPAQFKEFKYSEFINASADKVYNGRKHLSGFRINHL